MYGPCYWDQTQHIFTGFVSDDLPFACGKQFGHDMNPVVNALIGNWQIGGIMTAWTAATWRSISSSVMGTAAGSTERWSGYGNADRTLSSGSPDDAGLHELERLLFAGSSTGQPHHSYVLINGYLQAHAASESRRFWNLLGRRYSRTGARQLRPRCSQRIFGSGKLGASELRAEFLNAFNHPIWDCMGGPANGSFDPPGPGQNAGKLRTHNWFARRSKHPASSEVLLLT